MCDAGLFHSIYGTVHFRHQSWPLSDRASIVQVIGDEAEGLAYLFCTIDRPRGLVEMAQAPLVEFAEAGSWDHVVADLLEIEAANLLDQGGGYWLPRIAPYVSKSAQIAIDALHGGSEPEQCSGSDD